jgi:hypothetical protein
MICSTVQPHEMTGQQIVVDGLTYTSPDLALTAPHVAEIAAKLGRQCVDCSLCCKLLGVEEIQKPVGEWCDHCKPGHGCLIYESRPAACKHFACQWLIDGSFGDEWLPKRSKMVPRIVEREGRLVLIIDVDREAPGAWERPPYYAQLKARAATMQVQVNFRDRCFAILPEQEN